MKLPHVCFVNSVRPLGGAEIWMLDAARGLQERGHRVSFVAQPDGQLFLRARRNGFPTRGIPIRFDGAPWTLARLYRHFRHDGVDALYCNLTKDLKAAGVAGRMAGVRVILASRESDFPLKQKLYYRWYFNQIASGIVVNSEATRRTVLDSVPWLAPPRVHLLYKGVDLDRFHPAGVPPAVPTVGFVGQLVARKGLLEVMTAWEQLEREDLSPRPRLRLAGEGEWHGRLQSWRRSLRNPDLVEIHGFVEEIAEFLGGLSFLIMPSRAEGFGLAAAEASACGIPVIAADASSLPEVVHHERTGILIPPRNAGALAGAIRRLLAEPDLCSQLGRQGRQLMKEQFNREIMLDRLQKLVGGY